MKEGREGGKEMLPCARGRGARRPLPMVNRVMPADSYTSVGAQAFTLSCPLNPPIAYLGLAQPSLGLAKPRLGFQNPCLGLPKP